MKKVYSKPEIMFESFAMNVNIAACKVDTNLPSINQCGLDLGEGQTLFITGLYGCNVDGSTSDICYDNPSDTNNLFGS